MYISLKHDIRKGIFADVRRPIHKLIRQSGMNPTAFFLWLSDCLSTWLPYSLHTCPFLDSVSSFVLIDSLSIFLTVYPSHWLADRLSIRLTGQSIFPSLHIGSLIYDCLPACPSDWLLDCQSAACITIDWGDRRKKNSHKKNTNNNQPLNYCL